MNDNKSYYLPEWEREYYQIELIKEFPLHKDTIKSWNDIELMNCYDCDYYGRRSYFYED